jgi:hypothetical protein
MASPPDLSSLTTPTSPPAPTGASPRPSATATADTILRNALRYTISAREYASLHRYILSRSRLLKRRVPTVDTVQRVLDGQPYSRIQRGKSLSATDRSRSPRPAGPSEPGVATVPERRDPVASSADDGYNARAIRHSVRVFVATGAMMKLWAFVRGRLMSKKQE